MPRSATSGSHNKSTFSSGSGSRVERRLPCWTPKTFCSTRYGVTFPLFAKLEVNGDGRHPLYSFLTAAESAPDGPGDIKWNFAKFVVDPSGQVAARFDPSVDPEADEVVAAIEKAIAAG